MEFFIASMGCLVILCFVILSVYLDSRRKVFVVCYNEPSIAVFANKEDADQYRDWLNEGRICEDFFHVEHSVW